MMYSPPGVKKKLVLPEYNLAFIFIPEIDQQRPASLCRTYYRRQTGIRYCSLRGYPFYWRNDNFIDERFFKDHDRLLRPEIEKADAVLIVDLEKSIPPGEIDMSILPMPVWLEGI